MATFTPKEHEKAEIKRRVDLVRMNFAIFSLQGMLNTTRHIVSPFVSKRDAQWFEECIEYMLFKVRQSKVKIKQQK